jgi:hypothetical protein
VPAVSAADLIRLAKAEPSAAVAVRVARARAIQRERFEWLGRRFGQQERLLPDSACRRDRSSRRRWRVTVA